MLLSIILVSYNNMRVINDCLESLIKYNDAPESTEVIVVEQSEKDDIYNHLTFNYPWAKIIRNENVGFGNGNNYGVLHSSGKYLLFLNTDTILIEPVFKFAVNKFDSDPKLGAFGVQLLGKNLKKTMSYDVKKPFGLVNRVRYKIDYIMDYFDAKRMYISGADLFIRRELFNQIGGFDKNIFMYFEDTLLCSQVQQSGYDVRYFPEKKIIHLHGESTSKSDASINPMFLESYKYYCDVCNINYIDEIKKQIFMYKVMSLIKPRGKKYSNCIKQLETEVLCR